MLSPAGGLGGVLVVWDNMKFSLIDIDQKLRRKNHKGLFSPGIFMIYRICSEFIVIASSSFFILRILEIFIPWTILQFILFPVSFFIISGIKGGDEFLLIKNKKFLRFSKSFLKTIKVIGSILVILIFLNLFLNIINFLNQLFLNIFSEIESYLNIVIISVFFSVVFLLLYMNLFLTLFHFIQKKVNNSVVIIIKIFIAIILPVMCLEGAILPFFFSFSEIIYFKINWLIGFSLIFLHINYLITEITVFLKSRTLER